MAERFAQPLTDAEANTVAFLDTKSELLFKQRRQLRGDLLIAGPDQVQILQGNGFRQNDRLIHPLLGSIDKPLQSLGKLLPIRAGQGGNPGDRGNAGSRVILARCNSVEQAIYRLLVQRLQRAAAEMASERFAQQLAGVVPQHLAGFPSATDIDLGLDTVRPQQQEYGMARRAQRGIGGGSAFQDGLLVILDDAIDAEYPQVGGGLERRRRT